MENTLTLIGKIKISNNKYRFTHFFYKLFKNKVWTEICINALKMYI